mgnify:CR=1 FL=1
MKNRTYKTETGCPNDCDCLGFGHGGLEITTSARDIKREVLEILEGADRAALVRELVDRLDPAGAGRRSAKVEKDSPEHNCKHGIDVFNCYDGCYDEMKNGTVS